MERISNASSEFRIFANWSSWNPSIRILDVGAHRSRFDSDENELIAIT